VTATLVLQTKSALKKQLQNYFDAAKSEINFVGTTEHCTPRRIVWRQTLLEYYLVANVEQESIGFYPTHRPGLSDPGPADYVG